MTETDTPASDIGTATGLYRTGQPIADTKAPPGPIGDRWNRRKFEAKLVNPANRRKLSVIIVGTGLAGASAGATLAEAGYQVTSFCYQDSPRRAHSIAAQGGINAAKNYKADGDSVYRLFYDTVKGGDFRSRESNVYRLAEVSANIIDQCVAQGVPFAREYGGLLDNRSFGGVQVSRTFYARGQTGQQLLIGAYGALMRQVDAGTVKILPRQEMLDLVVIDGKARGIVTRNLVTGEIERFAGDAVLVATGGYSTAYFLSTNAAGYFTAGNMGVPGAVLTFGGNLLQNGQDAVALFAGNASDFPSGTAITATNLRDAIVYDNGQADDPGLLILLNADQPSLFLSH